MTDIDNQVLVNRNEHSSENWDQIESEELALFKNKELEEIYSNLDTSNLEKKVISGKIIDIIDREIIIDLGQKSNGLVSINELRDREIAIGDEIEVYVEKQENKDGYLQVSYRKAKIIKSWQQIEEAQQTDKIIEGVVKRRTKGGLIVDIYNIEAFLPGSQIDVNPIRDFDIFIDKRMEMKVININHQNENIIVSHKILIEKDLEEQRNAILSNLDKGQVLEGSVKNMTNFGAFIDLGGVDGLLHITDIIWGRISHPNEVLELDEKINVVVLDFDDEKKRISLGMKQLKENPWNLLSEDTKESSKVKGTVVNIMDYGVFVEIQKGVEGLVHISEMSWSQHPIYPQERFEIGQELEAIVLMIDKETKKMSLGLKQLTLDPWENKDIIKKYQVDTLHKGIIRNVTPFGFFLELEEGIDGLLHISDLSWTEKIKHPSQFAQVGDTLDIKILNINQEERRLALGHKQIEDNPWEVFEGIFKLGSVHEGTVIVTIDKGAIVELPYGIKGFCFNKNLALKDGKVASVGDTLPFTILNFSKDNKKVLVSHFHTYQVNQQPQKDIQNSDKKKNVSAKGNDFKYVNEHKKNTLGDLDVFKNIKKELADKAKAKTGTETKAEKSIETGTETKAEKSIETGTETKAEKSIETGTETKAEKSIETGTETKAEKSIETGTETKAEKSVETSKE